MTPKEKAEELYDKFHFALPSYADEGLMEHKLAKQCALIAVDEILNAIWIYLNDDVDYWQKVKTEIEAL